MDKDILVNNEYHYDDISYNNKCVDFYSNVYSQLFMEEGKTILLRDKNIFDHNPHNILELKQKNNSSNIFKCVNFNSAISSYQYWLKIINYNKNISIDLKRNCMEYLDILKEIQKIYHFIDTVGVDHCLNNISSHGCGAINLHNTLMKDIQGIQSDIEANLLDNIKLSDISHMLIKLKKVSRGACYFLSSIYSSYQYESLCLQGAKDYEIDFIESMVLILQNAEFNGFRTETDLVNALEEMKNIFIRDKKSSICKRIHENHKKNQIMGNNTWNDFSENILKIYRKKRGRVYPNLKEETKHSFDFIFEKYDSESFSSQDFILHNICLEDMKAWLIDKIEIQSQKKEVYNSLIRSVKESRKIASVMRLSNISDHLIFLKRFSLSEDIKKGCYFQSFNKSPRENLIDQNQYLLKMNELHKSYNQEYKKKRKRSIRGMIFPGEIDFFIHEDIDNILASSLKDLEPSKRKKISSQFFYLAKIIEELEKSIISHKFRVCVNSFFYGNTEFSEFEDFLDLLSTIKKKYLEKKSNNLEEEIYFFTLDLVQILIYMFLEERVLVSDRLDFGKSSFKDYSAQKEKDISVFLESIRLKSDCYNNHDDSRELFLLNIVSEFLHVPSHKEINHEDFFYKITKKYHLNSCESNKYLIKTEKEKKRKTDTKLFYAKKIFFYWMNSYSTVSSWCMPFIKGPETIKNISSFRRVFHGILDDVKSDLDKVYGKNEWKMHIVPGISGLQFEEFEKEVNNFKLWLKLKHHYERNKKYKLEELLYLKNSSQEYSEKVFKEMEETKLSKFEEPIPIFNIIRFYKNEENIINTINNENISNHNKKSIIDIDSSLLDWISIWEDREKERELEKKELKKIYDIKYVKNNNECFYKKTPKGDFLSSFFGFIEYVKSNFSFNTLKFPGASADIILRSEYEKIYLENKKFFDHEFDNVSNYTSEMEINSEENSDIVEDLALEFYLEESKDDLNIREKRDVLDSLETTSIILDELINKEEKSQLLSVKEEFLSGSFDKITEKIQLFLLSKFKNNFFLDKSSQIVLSAILDNDILYSEFLSNVPNITDREALEKSLLIYDDSHSITKELSIIPIEKRIQLSVLFWFASNSLNQYEIFDPKKLAGIFLSSKKIESIALKESYSLIFKEIEDVWIKIEKLENKLTIPFYQKVYKTLSLSDMRGTCAGYSLLFLDAYHKNGILGIDYFFNSFEKIEKKSYSENNILLIDHISIGLKKLNNLYNVQYNGGDILSLSSYDQDNYRSSIIRVESYDFSENILLLNNKLNSIKDGLYTIHIQNHVISLIKNSLINNEWIIFDPEIGYFKCSKSETVSEILLKINSKNNLNTGINIFKIEESIFNTGLLSKNKKLTTSETEFDFNYESFLKRDIIRGIKEKIEIIDIQGDMENINNAEKILISEVEYNLDKKIENIKITSFIKMKKKTSLSDINIKKEKEISILDIRERVKDHILNDEYGDLEGIDIEENIIDNEGKKTLIVSNGSSSIIFIAEDFDSISVSSSVVIAPSFVEENKRRIFLCTINSVDGYVEISGGKIIKKGVVNILDGTALVSNNKIIATENVNININGKSIPKVETEEGIKEVEKVGGRVVDIDYVDIVDEVQIKNSDVDYIDFLDKFHIKDDIDSFDYIDKTEDENIKKTKTLDIDKQRSLNIKFDFFEGSQEEKDFLLKTVEKSFELSDSFKENTSKLKKTHSRKNIAKKIRVKLPNGKIKKISINNKKNRKKPKKISTKSREKIAHSLSTNKITEYQKLSLVTQAEYDIQESQNDLLKEIEEKSKNDSVEIDLVSVLNPKESKKNTNRVKIAVYESKNGERVRKIITISKSKVEAFNQSLSKRFPGSSKALKYFGHYGYYGDLRTFISFLYIHESISVLENANTEEKIKSAFQISTTSLDTAFSILKYSGESLKMTSRQLSPINAVKAAKILNLSQNFARVVSKFQGPAGMITSLPGVGMSIYDMSTSETEYQSIVAVVDFLENTSSLVLSVIGTAFPPLQAVTATINLIITAISSIIRSILDDVYVVAYKATRGLCQMEFEMGDVFDSVSNNFIKAADGLINFYSHLSIEEIILKKENITAKINQDASTILPEIPSGLYNPTLCLKTLDDFNIIRCLKETRKSLENQPKLESAINISNITDPIITLPSTMMKRYFMDRYQTTFSGASIPKLDEYFQKIKEIESCDKEQEFPLVDACKEKWIEELGWVKTRKVSIRDENFYSRNRVSVRAPTAIGLKGAVTKIIIKDSDVKLVIPEGLGKKIEFSGKNNQYPAIPYEGLIKNKDVSVYNNPSYELFIEKEKKAYVTLNTGATIIVKDLEPPNSITDESYSAVFLEPMPGLIKNMISVDRYDNNGFYQVIVMEVNDVIEQKDLNDKKNSEEDPLEKDDPDLWKNINDICGFLEDPNPIKKNDLLSDNINKIENEDIQKIYKNIEFYFGIKNLKSTYSTRPVLFSFREWKTSNDILKNPPFIIERKPNRNLVLKTIGDNNFKLPYKYGDESRIITLIKERVKLSDLFLPNIIMLQSKIDQNFFINGWLYKHTDRDYIEGHYYYILPNLSSSIHEKYPRLSDDLSLLHFVSRGELDDTDRHPEGNEDIPYLAYFYSSFYKIMIKQYGENLVFLNDIQIVFSEPKINIDPRGFEVVSCGGLINFGSRQKELKIADRNLAKVYSDQKLLAESKIKPIFILESMKEKHTQKTDEVSLDKTNPILVDTFIEGHNLSPKVSAQVLDTGIYTGRNQRYIETIIDSKSFMIPIYKNNGIIDTGVLGIINILDKYYAVLTVTMYNKIIQSFLILENHRQSDIEMDGYITSILTNDPLLEIKLNPRKTGVIYKTTTGLLIDQEFQSLEIYDRKIVEVFPDWFKDPDDELSLESLKIRVEKLLIKYKISESRFLKVHLMKKEYGPDNEFFDRGYPKTYLYDTLKKIGVVIDWSLSEITAGKSLSEYEVLGYQLSEDNQTILRITLFSESTKTIITFDSSNNTGIGISCNALLLEGGSLFCSGINKNPSKISYIFGLKDINLLDVKAEANYRLKITEQFKRSVDFIRIFDPSSELKSPQKINIEFPDQEKINMRIKKHVLDNKTDLFIYVSSEENSIFNSPIIFKNALNKNHQIKECFNEVLSINGEAISIKTLKIILNYSLNNEKSLSIDSKTLS